MKLSDMNNAIKHFQNTSLQLFCQLDMKNMSK